MQEVVAAIVIIVALLCSCQYSFVVGLEIHYVIVASCCCGECRTCDVSVTVIVVVPPIDLGVFFFHVCASLGGDAASCCSCSC